MRYVGFGNFVVNAGATWVMNANTIGFAATLTDNGGLTNSGRIFTTVTLGAGASLTNASDGVTSGSPSFGR